MQKLNVRGRSEYIWNCFDLWYRDCSHIEMDVLMWEIKKKNKNVAGHAMAGATRENSETVIAMNKRIKEEEKNSLLP